MIIISAQHPLIHLCYTKLRNRKMEGSVTVPICPNCHRQVPYRQVSTNANGNQGRFLAKVRLEIYLDGFWTRSHEFLWASATSGSIRLRTSSATFSAGIQTHRQLPINSNLLSTSFPHRWPRPSP